MSEPDRPGTMRAVADESDGLTTACQHEAVGSSGIMPGPGGEMHEVGVCSGCGAMLRRSNPLQQWAFAEDGD